MRTCCTLVLLVTLTMSDSTAQDTCDAELARGEKAYVEGRFDKAIERADACLVRSDADMRHRVASHRLMARAYIRSDRLPEARLSIMQILQMQPDYEADPVNDPPPYTVLVAIVRDQVMPAEDRPPPRQFWTRSNRAGW